MLEGNTKLQTPSSREAASTKSQKHVSGPRAIVALIPYFVALFTGEAQISTQPFYWMAAWVAIAVTGGWLLQSLLVLFISKAKNTKPSN